MLFPIFWHNQWSEVSGQKSSKNIPVPRVVLSRTVTGQILRASTKIEPQAGLKPRADHNYFE